MTTTHLCSVWGFFGSNTSFIGVVTAMTFPERRGHFPGHGEANPEMVNANWSPLCLLAHLPVWVAEESLSQVAVTIHVQSGGDREEEEEEDATAINQDRNRADSRDRCC